MPTTTHSRRLAPRRLPAAAFLVGLALTLAPIARGAAPPSEGQLPGAGPDWPPPARLVRHPAEILMPDGAGLQAALRRAHPSLDAFLRQHPAWKATMDPHTGGVERAFGDSLPAFDDLDPAEALNDPDSSGRAGRAARSFLAHHGDLLAPGLDLSAEALVLDDGPQVALADPAVLVVRLGQRHQGLPVLGAGLTLAVRDGRVFFLSAAALGPVRSGGAPRLDADRALAALRAHLIAAGASVPADLALSREAALAYLPRADAEGRGLAHDLAWVLEVRPRSAPGWLTHVAHVDARDGRVLALCPEARNAGSCSADPAQARAAVLGGVRPNRADEPEAILHFPFARVSVGGVLVSSDVNGRYPYDGGAVTSGLQGTLFKARCFECTGPAQPSAAGDESGDVDFGSGGGSGPAPVPGNGVSTPADRAAFYHLNQAWMFLDKWNNAFFDEIEALVNINSSCNAFSSGHQVGFFAKSATCNNTGEIRDVMQHELGHTWDRFDGNGITSGATSEWKGDVLALLIGGDSCVGESFRLSGGPTTACSGVRDLDEKAPGRLDHVPTPGVCPTCATVTRLANDCGGEIHCVGEIPGQASWHLLENLLTGADYISGAGLPGANPGFSAEQARWIMERLLVAGGPPMQTFNPTAAGVSIYDALLLADDEDGNLANGTPNAAYINAALGHHELQESPVIADAANCPALADPVPSVTLDRDAGTGLPAVRIDWTPSGGGATFDVYRNTRAGDAFLPIAREAAAGPVVDPGVQVGVTYRYFVAAVRKTGCAAISPGSNVVSIAVTPPELRIAAKVLAESPGGSDGDGRIEPGERATIQITLGEIGGAAAAAGVSASLSSDSPFSPVTSGGPVSFGTVPAGGTAPGASAYEVLVGPSEPCGGRVHLVLATTGTDGCWLDSFDVPIASVAAGCAESPSAFVEVVPGSVQVVSAAGDADGIPDNCEATTVQYQVRNAGSLAAGPVTSGVTTSHPGVTISPQTPCTLASLGPGATAACQFTFSLGGATAAGVPFVVTADSTTNATPSVLPFVLPAEADPHAYATLSYDFEVNLSGWTARNFSLSSARAASGALSVHAGSTTVNNLCAKLTSQSLRLQPGGSPSLTFQMFAMIEPLTDQWYDRANVHVIDLDTNEHILVAPSSGTPYNASGNIDGQMCHLNDQDGWGGPLGGFGAVGFDLSGFAGRRVRLEINYNSDEGDNREGIYVDDVVLSGAAADPAPADPQADACPLPEVSGPASAVPLDVERLAGGDLRFVWQDLGPGFQYNLYAGSLGAYYSHGGPAPLCGALGSGGSCAAGECGADLASAGIPAGDLYFLVTGAAFGGEGTSGSATSGVERDPLQSTCPP